MKKRAWILGFVGVMLVTTSGFAAENRKVSCQARAKAPALKQFLESVGAPTQDASTAQTQTTPAAPAQNTK